MSTPDYDSDFYAWTQHQAAAIRAGQWEQLDREHVAEEIADLWHQDRHDSAMLVLGFLELAYGHAATRWASITGNRPSSTITGGCCGSASKRAHNYARSYATAYPTPTPGLGSNS